MNSDRPQTPSRAFTLIELLVVIGIIGILAALLLPALSRGKAQAKRAACGNNLQEIGLGFHSFAHEHDGKFPMRVDPEDGGTLMSEEAHDGPVELFAPAFGPLRALSNELVTPKILICPADARVAADNFPGLNNDRVSYFVAVNAEYGRPEMILAGDRNLANAGTNSAGNPALRWTDELHRHKGNILFADGHVARLNNPVFEVAALGGTPQNVVLPDLGSGGPTDGLFPQDKPKPPTAPAPLESPGGNNSSSKPRLPAFAPNPAASFSTPLGRFSVPASVLPALAAQPKAIARGTNQVTPATALTSSGETEAMGTFDATAVRALQWLVKGGFGLLLLLLLLCLAYVIWREWQKRRGRRDNKEMVVEER